VSDWIKKHVDDNPLVILTPVFKDYERHLTALTDKCSKDTAQSDQATGGGPSTGDKSDDLMAKFKPQAGTWSCNTCMITNQPDKEKCVACETPKPGSKPKENVPAFSLNKSSEFKFGSADMSDSNKTSGFKLGESKPSDDASVGVAKSGFMFSSSTDKVGGFSASTDKPGGFTFGSSTATTANAGFSFGSSTTTAAKPFSFGSFTSGAATAAAAATVNTKEEDNEEEDAPPVVEVKQVTEEDSIYSKKCKLFYKKDESYVEKGVGMLHLKPTENDKTQLLIRADTNLGNILLNILLNPQIPTTRVGKNNVMLVCVANPPLDAAKAGSDAAPTPMLIRVKTAEDADELKSKLDELKEN